MNKPTVTQLLNVLNKPALVYWANKLGLHGTSLSDYYAKSRGDGISLHKQINDYIKNGKAMNDEKNQILCDMFFKDKEVLAMEKDIENIYFRGRYDMLFRSNGYTYIADFKSSKDIYFENKLQLVAYRKCIPIQDIKYCIIQIPEFILKPVLITKNEERKMYSMLKKLSYIYNTQKTLC